MKSTLNLAALFKTDAFVKYQAIPVGVRSKLAEYRTLENAAIEAAVSYLANRYSKGDREVARKELEKVSQLAPFLNRLLARLFPRIPHKLGKAGQAKLASVVASLGSAVGCFGADELPAVRAWLVAEVTKLVKAATEKADAKAEKK